MPNSKHLNKLAELVETNAVDAERLDEHLHGSEPLGISLRKDKVGEILVGTGLISLREVRKYIPVGRRTVLRWEREKRVRVYRPNNRRAFVALDDLLQAWNSCGGN